MFVSQNNLHITLPRTSLRSNPRRDVHGDTYLLVPAKKCQYCKCVIPKDEHTTTPHIETTDMDLTNTHLHSFLFHFPSLRL